MFHVEQSVCENLLFDELFHVEQFIICKDNEIIHHAFIDIVFICI